MKITLAMLTYNSGKYIPESIGNMLPYVDETVVTVDIRTKDRTREILNNWIKEGYKIRWKEYEWKHHYGEAKNELIRMVTPIGRDSWMIIYDDDEKIKPEDCKKFTEFIRNLNPIYKVGGLLVARKNVYPDWIYDEKNYLKFLYPDPHMIAFRRVDGVGYEGRVHEWASNSLTSRGYEIANYLDICTWHHAWKGSREKNEMKKHLYYIALSTGNIAGHKWEYEG